MDDVIKRIKEFKAAGIKNANDIPLAKLVDLSLQFLEVRQIPVAPRGYRQLLESLKEFGEPGDWRLEWITKDALSLVIPYLNQLFSRAGQNDGDNAK
jgi:hypothetical protein